MTQEQAKQIAIGLIKEHGLKHDDVFPVEVKRDWEIHEFKGRKGWDNMMLGSDGKYGNSHFAVSLDCMLHIGNSVDSGHYTIHKVKRLSDGAVFTVGDNMKPRVMNEYIIGKFIISTDGSNKIGTLDKRDSDMGGYGCTAWLHEITPVPALPILFTTHDGVEVTSITEIVYTLGIAFDTFTITAASVLDYKTRYGSHLIFSTLEARTDYIIENKPLFSIKELREMSLEECYICMEHSQLLSAARTKVL